MKLKRKPQKKSEPDGSTQVHIGVFPLDYVNCDFFIFPRNTGGEFYLNPQDKSLPRIKIGIFYREWNEVLNVLLHEIFEATLCMHHLRYEKCGSRGGGDRYSFHFTHAEFTEVTVQASKTLAAVYPVLLEHYIKEKETWTT